MRIGDSFDSNSRPGIQPWMAQPRRCEKSSDSSDLGQERPRFRAGDPQTGLRRRADRPSQDETSHSDPYYDGPRLLPAFAAQLIGQSMPERRDAVRVETAYGSVSEPRRAMLLDRKS